MACTYGCIRLTKFVSRLFLNCRLEHRLYFQTSPFQCVSALVQNLWEPRIAQNALNYLLPVKRPMFGFLIFWECHRCSLLMQTIQLDAQLSVAVESRLLLWFFRWVCSSFLPDPLSIYSNLLYPPIRVFKKYVTFCILIFVYLSSQYFFFLFQCALNYQPRQFWQVLFRFAGRRSSTRS